MSNLRLGVIGAGHLGRIHARLAGSAEGVDVVAVADPTAAARELVSQQCGTPTVSHYSEFLGTVDAVIIATPTSNHFEITRELLTAGVSCLVEKPLVTQAVQATVLRDLAREYQCVLQVGHVERFNPAWTAVRDQLTRPRYIEARRNGVYTGRSTDIGIVFDLMIHDLDLVLQICQSELVDVTASCATILGQHEDLAKATLRFKSGCVANLSASRIEPETVRAMKVVTDTSIAEIDFGASTATVSTIANDVLCGERSADDLPPEQRQLVKDDLFSSWMPTKSLDVRPTNAIADEQADFFQAIRSGQLPKVTADQAIRTIEVAERILDAARQTEQQFDAYYDQELRVISAANRFGRSHSRQRKAG